MKNPDHWYEKEIENSNQTYKDSRVSGEWRDWKIGIEGSDDVVKFVVGTIAAVIMTHVVTNAWIELKKLKNKIRKNSKEEV